MAKKIPEHLSQREVYCFIDTLLAKFDSESHVAVLKDVLATVLISDQVDVTNELKLEIIQQFGHLNLNKLDVVKYVKNKMGWSLMEAKQWTETMWNTTPDLRLIERTYQHNLLLKLMLEFNVELED